MKKIMIIGKMNQVLQDISDYLSGYFRVQICANQLDVTLGMIKVVKPDLIIISLVGTYDVDNALFAAIYNEYSEIPVLTIGTEGEKQRFRELFTSGQFENLIRPIENNQLILEAICRRLSMDMEMLEENRETKEEDTRTHVLVVDDSAPTLRSISKMLSEKYKVTLANSGMKAMTSMGKKKPDVILLDYEMPVCDGRQTLEMIRAEEELKDIPVIFLTGVSDREHINAVLRLRPTGYLLKPAIKDVLIREIEKAVHGEK